VVYLVNRRNKGGKNKKFNKKEKPEEKKVKYSRLFVKCRNLMNKSSKEFDSGNTEEAKRAYAKTVNIYIKMDYEERKTIFKGLLELYNKLNK